MTLFKKHIGFCAVIFLFLLIGFQPGPAAGSDYGSKPWTDLPTRHTILKYKSDEDLLRFHKAIDYGPGKWNRGGSFSSVSRQELEEMLVQKVDAIFERAQKILDMRKKMEKISVNIYPDSNELKNAFSLIYRGAQCKLRAWYRYRNNTVYINSEDTHAGMLAHELAHGIIDHYFGVRPPPETAEILARYVDSHL